MPFFEWNPELSVGFVKLDDDHRHLISLLNQLHSAMADGQGRLALNSILQGLVWYTQSHFKAEELLMNCYVYPELALHKVEHEGFASRVAQFTTDLETGRDGSAVEVLETMQQWLELHIMRCDAAYVTFFQANGIADIKLPQLSPVL